MDKYQEFVEKRKAAIQQGVDRSDIGFMIDLSCMVLENFSFPSDALEAAQDVLLLCDMAEKLEKTIETTGALEIASKGMNNASPKLGGDLANFGVRICGDIEKRRKLIGVPRNTKPIESQEWWRREYTDFDLSAAEVSVPANDERNVARDDLESERTEFFEACERMVNNSDMDVGDDISLCANSRLLEPSLAINPLDALSRAYKLLLLSDKAVAGGDPKLAFVALGYADQFVQKVGEEDRRDEFISSVSAVVEDRLAGQREKIANLPRKLGTKKLVAASGEVCGQTIPIEGAGSSIPYDPATMYDAFIKGGAWSTNGEWAEVSAEHPNSEISAKYYGGRDSDEIIHATTTYLLKVSDGDPERALRKFLGVYKDKSAKPGTVLAVYTARVALELVGNLAYSSDTSRHSLLLRRDACMFIAKNLHLKDRKKRPISANEVGLIKRFGSLLQAIQINNTGKIHQQMCGVTREVTQVEGRLEHIYKIQDGTPSGRTGLTVLAGGRSRGFRIA